MSALFFVQAVAMAAWFVPLSPVLEAHQFSHLRSYAFATSAVAALVTPLLFGAIADRHVSPVRVLRWAALGSAILTGLAIHAINARWPDLLVLGLIQIQAFVATPTWSLLNSITLASLRHPQKEFGPVRAFGTFGWIAGCLLISALNADASTRAGLTAATSWLVLVVSTQFVRAVPPPAQTEHLSLRQRFGLDALNLLRMPEYRVLFLAAAFTSIPLAAFYPFAPAHLRDLGFERTSAWMSLAQATEVIAMFSLSTWLGRFGFRTVLTAGLGFAALRYLLLASNDTRLVFPGIALHGFAFTLFFVTAPICLNESVGSAWRTRAQALLSLTTQGLGNLAGYLGTGWWLQICTSPAGTQWSLFWGGLGIVVLLVLGLFVVTYRSPKQSPGATSAA